MTPGWPKITKVANSGTREPGKQGEYAVSPGNMVQTANLDLFIKFLKSSETFRDSIFKSTQVQEGIMAYSIIALINQDKCYADSDDVQTAVVGKHGEGVCVWFRSEREMNKVLLDEIRLEKIVEMRREQIMAGPRNSYTVKYLLITVDV